MSARPRIGDRVILLYKGGGERCRGVIVASTSEPVYIIDTDEHGQQSWVKSMTIKEPPPHHCCKSDGCPTEVRP